MIRNRLPALLSALLLVGCHPRRGGARAEPASAGAPPAAAAAGRGSGGADPWGNPFGVFYAGKHGAAIAATGAALRVMVHQEEWEGAAGPITYDQAVLRAKRVEGTIVTLMPQTTSRQRKGVEAIGYHKYCLPEGEELERSLRFARQLVERYDGDADFGCRLGDGPDCYVEGDRAYPSDPEGLRARPIKIWQFENEPFFQVVDCAASVAPASGERLSAYLAAGAAAMRAADPGATLVFPAVAGLRAPLMDRGLVDTVDVGPTDCAHERYTRADVEADPAKVAKQRALVRRERERIEHVFTHAARAYDAIDFHTYGNDVREAPAIKRWLDSLGLGDRALVSTEMAGPYFMFLELGAPRPTRCAAGGRDDRGPARYDDALLSAFVVKKYVVGLAAGVKRMHWATGEELFDPYLDNYQRLALIEKAGRLKPAYFTYALLVEKLLGFTGPVEKRGGDVYVFRFGGKGPVVVAWADGHGATVDLSAVFPAGRANVTRLVVALDEGGNPVRPSVERQPSAAVPVSDRPVFVEAAP